MPGKRLKASAHRSPGRRSGPQAGPELFHALVEHSSDAVALLDETGAITYVSQAATRLLGYGVPELTGTNALGFLHPDDLALTERLCRQLLDQPGTPIRTELRARHKDGSYHLVEAVAVNRLDDPAVGAGVANWRDITERLRAEQALRNSEQSYRSLVDGVRDVIFALSPGGEVTSLNPAFEEMTGFPPAEWVGRPFEAFVHPDDVPLALDLFGRVLQGEPRPTIQFRILTRAGTYRVAEFSATAQLRDGRLTGILGIGRDVTERLGLEQQLRQPKVVDLNALVLDMDKLLRRLIGEDVELATVLDPTLGRVTADPGQLEQVIVNLAVNARDAMPQGGKLTLETRNIDLDSSYTLEHSLVKPGPYVQLTVSDSGIGMDEETQAHAFEPFFTTKPRGQGTGLGLAMVYGTVKQSGGFIWVYSEPGRGATFKIYLPRVDAPVESAAPPAPVERPPRGSETVLLAEDEPAVRAIARQAPERQGYTVLAAPSGADALALAAQHGATIHLLLTDVVMPGMSGRDLADRLTAQRPGIRVLYISGYTDNAIVRHGMLEPGLAYLQKPFRPDALVRKVREVLDAG